MKRFDSNIQKLLESAGLFLVSRNLMMLHQMLIRREKLLIPKFIFFMLKFSSIFIITCLDLQESMNKYQFEIN